MAHICISVNALSVLTFVLSLCNLFIKAVFRWDYISLFTFLEDRRSASEKPPRPPLLRYAPSVPPCQEAGRSRRRAWYLKGGGAFILGKRESKLYVCKYIHMHRFTAPPSRIGFKTETKRGISEGGGGHLRNQACDIYTFIFKHIWIGFTLNRFTYTYLRIHMHICTARLCQGAARSRQRGWYLGGAFIRGIRPAIYIHLYTRTYEYA